jgi:uncharacterized membrane protein
MAFALRQPYRRRAARRDVPADTARPSVARTAAARGAWAVGSLLLGIARVVRLITWLVVLVIVVGIVLRVLSANPSNTIVHDIHSVGQTLVGPFKNVFSIHNAKADMAANWGLAALVYLIVGSIIASLIARMAPTGVHPSQPVPAE